ncbi:hypothetical protein R1sor_000803 [Riccia sorocarpa]|uniref:Reverse transcriptase domain-containing protein n=1 Tax=Riccia sorocarpa TaxID=122646 RepID=A0ABD3GYC2_9MARC
MSHKYIPALRRQCPELTRGTQWLTQARLGSLSLAPTSRLDVPASSLQNSITCSRGPSLSWAPQGEAHKKQRVGGGATLSSRDVGAKERQRRRACAIHWVPRVSSGHWRRSARIYLGPTYCAFPETTCGGNLGPDPPCHSKPLLHSTRGGACRSLPNGGSDDGPGVIQGDPLSPFLFNIYINDAIDPDMADTEVLGLDSPLSVLLLADDVALIERSETRLRHALQHFSDWATLWGLDIGHSTCGVLPFGAPFGPFRPFLAQDGSIPLVTDYKYLGVTFTRDIIQIFTTWLQERAAKGRQLLKRWRFALGNSQLTLADRILMFKVIFLPAILYGCELEGGRGRRSMRILEAIIGRALRIIIGKTPVSTQLNTVLLQREFHVPPVYATAVSRLD